MHQQVLLPVGRAPDYRIQMSVALHLDMRTFFFSLSDIYNKTNNNLSFVITSHYFPK